MTDQPLDRGARTSAPRASFPERISICLALGALLAGCTVGPDYEPPETYVPDDWHQEVVQGLGDGTGSLHTWWTTLGDPMLESLIDRAAANNRELHVAIGRIAEAQALYGFSRGERYPDFDAAGAVQRQRSSADFRPKDPATGNRSDSTETFRSLGFDATWEIDLWGRITRSIESAEAGYESSIENYRDVLVVLFSDVATTYIQARAFQERIEFAEGNIKTQEGSLRLTSDRFRAELVGKLDVRQAELNLATTEAFVPLLRQELMFTINRLSVLVGEPPGPLQEQMLIPKPVPEGTLDVTAGVPADLLRQRPDVRQAERDLAAASAQIGVATADLYPRFSLTGFFAFEGTADIFDSSKQAWAIGPAVRWNLFDGGRVRSAIKAEEARTEQAFANYENTVFVAIEEVENAMTAYVEEQIRRESLRRSVTAASESVKLVNTLYRTGLTDFQNVLDTERSLFQQEDALAESEGLVSENLVRIYRTLGGGWKADDDAEAPPEGEASHDATLGAEPATAGEAASQSASGDHAAGGDVQTDEGA